MPNVKPGDLAIVKGAPHSNGNIFEIIEEAPSHRFLLPNGQPHAGRRGSELKWVVKVHGFPMSTTFADGIRRQVRYGVALDRYLFPLADPDEVNAEDSAELIS